MERFHLIKLFSAIIAFLLINPVTASGLRWNIDTVASGAEAYWATDITLDSNENPHVSFYVLTDPWNNLISPGYAYRDGGTWQTDSSIDESLGWEIGFYDPNISIALDSNDYPVITYWWGDPHALYRAVKRARWDGSTWLTREIDKGGMYNSLALDSNDCEHITYGMWFDWPLHYVYWDGSDWNYEVIDNGFFNSLTLDSSDTPHVAYYNDGNLKYAYKDGPDWVTEVVDVGGRCASIALDSDGNPHIAHWYYDYSELKYAFWDGASWHLETLDGHTGGSDVWTSIAVDSAGHPHIVYRDTVDDYGIKYIFWDGYDWVEEVVVSGWYPSLVLNSSDLPRIAYISGGSVKFAEGFVNTPPSSFGLAQPPDGGEVVEPVTLDWEDSTDDDGDTITYDAWYATDPSFDPHDEVNELTDSTYTFSEGVLSDGTTYYWKVRATDGYAETWSGPDEYWSFTVNAPPGDFDLTAPPDGGVVTEPVTLDWEDSVDPGRTLPAGAGSSRTAADTGLSKSTRSITYDVWYATDPSFDPHDEVNELTDSTYTFPEGTLSDGTTYYWKVRAWDGFDATWSGPGPYWSFTVEEEVTDIPVTVFSAESARNGVELTWECADPGVGFNLYRSEEATGLRSKLWEMINAELITGESPYSYFDAAVEDGVTYAYWLEAMDVGGADETFGPVSCTAGTFVPTAYALYQSRPNPARGTAVIAFDLPEGVDVTLTIYDISGRKVTTLVNETLPAGAHERPVAGLAHGVYVYRLVAGGFSGVRKMVVVE